MKQRWERNFNAVYWATCFLVLIAVIARCALVPFSHDEVATFHFYIQTGDFLPFVSHADANNHFLMSFTGWICFKLFGSSPLALRLPCIFAFILLCYSVYRMNEFMKCAYGRIVFTSGFIVAFNFISFFSLCRGYGMSMAFLIMALYYFLKYREAQNNPEVPGKHLLRGYFKFFLFSQLALSANLTLVFVIGICSVVVILWQFRNKLFFKPLNLFVLLIHFFLLGFWIKYAFFLKENGALYYGGGESYWDVTFATLIDTIVFKNKVVYAVILGLFMLMCAYWIFKVFTGKREFLTYSKFSISFLLLVTLILAFYALKKVVGVNYPEDRTGLFFYVFFMLSLSFMIPELKKNLQPLFLFIPLFFIGHFLMNMNTRVHPWRVYETMPAGFFDMLKQEQKKTDYPVTVAGHRVREFFYGFLNYNSDLKLSQMTAPEALQMNADYALAYKQDKPWYEPYYRELAEDKDWDFRLLKRKKPIERILLLQTGPFVFEGAHEYFNAFEKLDTTLQSPDPILAEFDFTVERAPVPFNAWLVLQVDGQDTSNFIRTPFNLIKYDWNGTKNFKTVLLSGNIPVKIKRMVAYLWNIEKKEIKIKINSFKLYKLKGEGIREISKAKI
jgi:hypothetical protein